MSPLTLPQIEVTGSPREMGRGHGEALRERIHAFVAQRLAAAHAYAAERSRDAKRLVDVGRQCLEVARRFDPEGTEEHDGIAEGAGVDSGVLYTTASMTDVRDVLLLGIGEEAAREGCSALIAPARLTRRGEVLAGQTWDLNFEDLDFVVAVRRRPSTGGGTWSVTCAGCLSLVVMNDAGLSIGTTNLKVKGSRPGASYLSIIHRAIRERDRFAAGRVVEGAPRAAAHTYWIADETGAREYECSAERFVMRELEDEPIVRTNHCADSAHVAAEGEEPGASSRRRLARLAALLAPGAHDESTIRAIYADRADGVDSICRYPEDAQGTATNACVIARPLARTLHVCKGPSDRGEWVELRM